MTAPAGGARRPCGGNAAQLFPVCLRIARRAREAKVECKICGNLVKNLDRVGDLVSGGIVLFCVAPSFIPVLKEAIGEYLSSSEADNRPGSRE